MTRSIRADLIKVFKACYLPVLPSRLIQKHVVYNKCSDNLHVMGNNISLRDKKVFMVGAGKGVQLMSYEIEQLLGNKIEKGIMSIPHGSSISYTNSDKIVYYEGARSNLPDAEAEKTAKLIKKLAESLTCDDILLVLITGGGSALLPLPIAPISLKEKTELVRKLANAGADIKELNIVRKRISDIKGGKLAMCTKATTVTLIISDIVNNPFGLIASGPTVKNEDDPKEAVSILEKYSLLHDLPLSIKCVLEKEIERETFPSVQYFGYDVTVIRVTQNDFEFVEDLEKVLEQTITTSESSTEIGNAKKVPNTKEIKKGMIHERNENEKDVIGPSQKVLNFLLGSNVASVQAAYNEILALKAYVPIVISHSVTGNIEEIASSYFSLTKIFGDFINGKLQFNDIEYLINNITYIPGVLTDIRFLDNLMNPSFKNKNICLILAGETTVTVKGTGKGGRNQQLAMEFSKVLHVQKCKGTLDKLNVYMLCAGTDGIDGPTDAAGAIAYRDLYSECLETGIPVNTYLDNNDSYTFYKTFKNGLYHVKTGHTGTNVMDINLITISKDTFVYQESVLDSDINKIKRG